MENEFLPILGYPALSPLWSMDPVEHPYQEVPDNITFPPLERFSGSYHFSTTCKRPTFSNELNTLFVTPQTGFVVEFESDSHALLSVRAMVCYADPADLAKLGPIRPCSCNAHVEKRKPEYGKCFIVSGFEGAKYADVKGHGTVTVNLSNMQYVNGKYNAVYSYASYTSCLAQGAKVATVFSLMVGEEEVGRDILYCNVCACPLRDMKKAVERHHCPPQHRRKSRSRSAGDETSSPNSSASLDQSTSSTDSTPGPGGSGCYVFHWEMKDREMYHHLCGLKGKYQELEQQLQSLSSP